MNRVYERQKSHLCYLLTVSPPVEFDLFMFPHPLPLFVEFDP